MARYPTFEEYRKRGNYAEGLKRCDDLLKKNPNDAQLLTVKLQLLYATEGNAQEVLDQLAALQPPIQDLREIVAIEDVVETSQRDIYPRPTTVGPVVATIWSNAFKASTSTNHKLDLLSLRYSRAIVDNRLTDAQQALIQLKALQPRNRVIYMAHAAVTQLSSTSKEDLQSRLALSLARKAVKENFDEDKVLDCRVPGQIFALQESMADLEGIENRSFKESKQVLDALRRRKAGQVNGGAEIVSNSETVDGPAADGLAEEVRTLRQKFNDLVTPSVGLGAIEEFATESTKLFHKAQTSKTDLRGRGLAHACFLSISALVRAFELSHGLGHLLHAAFLAEQLLQRSPHIHEARLILVYLYMRLGLGSLAIRLFHSLNVKEIQHDTVGHVLFTRLSLTHPQSTKVSRRDVLDPQRRLSLALTMYTRHDEKLAETEAGVLNHEQTGMLFDLRQLRSSLRSSVTRRIIYLEQRRVARLLHDAAGEDPAQMGPRVLANWLEVTDQRDFAATFDFGYNVERVLYGYKEVQEDGLSRDKRRILYSLATDCAWCLAAGGQPAIKDVHNLVHEMDGLTAGLQRLDVGDEDAIATGAISRAEHLAGQVACQLLKLLLASTSDGEHTKTNIESISKAVQQLNVDNLLSANNVFTERITHHFIYFDILRIVQKACKHLTTKTKESASELQQLQNLANSYSSNIVKCAQEQGMRVNAAEIKTFMEQDGWIGATTALFGESSIADFCESISSSAKEGWEGLTKCAPV